MQIHEVHKTQNLLQKLLKFNLQEDDFQFGNYLNFSTYRQGCMLIVGINGELIWTIKDSANKQFKLITTEGILTFDTSSKKLVFKVGQKEIIHSNKCSILLKKLIKIVFINIIKNIRI